MTDPSSPPVAIVTGASRGIGAACAIALAKAGLRLFLVAEGSAAELRDVVAACDAAHPAGAGAAFSIHDLADSAAPEAAAQAALAAFGRVDVLVNNAGIRIRKPLGTFTVDEFDQIFAVNVRAALMLSQAVLPAMRAQGGGRIIHMASQLGLVADPGAALYGMTKAALIHLTRVMALELATENIQVNAVSPGPIGTDYYLERVRLEPDLLPRRLAHVPMKRLGTPEEVAEAIVFLATTSARYIHGHNLVVDGGFVIH